MASDDGGLKATNRIGITVVKAASALVTISNAAFNAGTFSFSFGTETGYNYEGQFATPLWGSNSWRIDECGRNRLGG